MILLNEPAAYSFFGEHEFFRNLSPEFFFRLVINFISVFVLVRMIYYSIYKKNEFFFSFFMFNLIIFLICYLLKKIEISIGAAFGLFAVFSMLRYRTEGISIKDMTYLFLSIAIGLITSVSGGGTGELLLFNGIILGFTYLMEKNFLFKKEISQVIQYEKIDLIKPEYHTLLLDDLKKRTGLNIHRFSFDKIDFLRDTVVITVYYYE